MPKIITAVKVENKTSVKGGSYQIITDGEGNKYGLWQGNMEQGIAYEVDVEDKGKYHDIKSFSKVADKLPVNPTTISKGQPETPPPTPKTFVPKQESSDEKQRSVALAYAKDWCIAKNQIENKLGYQDVLTVAGIFESYIKNGITTEKK